MTDLVIGVGNSFRRDDGVGLAVADEVAGIGVAGVRVTTATGEPGAILEAWTGASLAIVIDAAVGEDAIPGRVRRWVPGGAPVTAVSSHELGLPATYALGQALDRVPQRLVVLTVDAADVGYGAGLTAEVEAAVPGVVASVLHELGV